MIFVRSHEDKGKIICFVFSSDQLLKKKHGYITDLTDWQGW